jgi:hypothetical protein
MDNTLERHARQAWRKRDLAPSPAERRILDTILRSDGVIVAYRNGKPTASLANGMSLRLDRFDMELAVELGWLRPDPKSPSLLPGAPTQRYFAVELVGEDRR